MLMVFRKDSYSDSNSYVAKHNRPTIGGEGVDFANNPFSGIISNVRVVKGSCSLWCTFTPPQELVVHYKQMMIKLFYYVVKTLITLWKKQQEKNFLGKVVYRGKRHSNLATNGNLETGDTTNWVMVLLVVLHLKVY